MIAAPETFTIGATFWKNAHPRGKQSLNKMENEAIVKWFILSPSLV